MTQATDKSGQEPPSPNPASALKPGDRFGAYSIVSQLGASQASVLWRARDTSAGKEVVIRELIPGSPAARERSFLERCQREVEKHQALAGNVRRVVLINELSDDPRGAFIVSDFVSGASVDQLLASRPDPFDLVRGLRIIHATAKVLDQVHTHGLIHGGLRPSNIILRLSGGVQVCDVGLAGLIADQEALSPDAARYMAPELFHGNAADETSDVYALGMVAYEMLAGRGAFEKAFTAVLSDPRNSAVRWMKWHTNINAMPTPLHELNPFVPVRLGDLVSRMMSKDRTKRITSASQLLEAIQRHFGQKTIDQADVSPDAFSPSGPQVATTGPGDTAVLPPQSKVPMIFAIAAAVLLFIAGGVWLTVSTIKSQRLAEKRSQSAEVLADADRDYAAGRFSEALTDYEAQAVTWPSDSDPLGLHGRAGALLAKAQIDLVAGDYDSVLVLLHSLDNLGEAGPASRQAVKDLTEEVQRRQAFEKTIVTIQEHMDAGRFAQARALIEESHGTGLTEDEKKRLLDYQVQIDTVLNSQQIEEALAEVDKLAEQGEYEGAINHLEGISRRIQSPRIVERLQTLKTELQVSELVKQGDTHEDAGELEQAVSALQKALDLHDDPALAARIPLLKARAEVEKGRALAESGDAAAAQAAFTAALGYDPNSVEARGWLARMNVTIEKQSQVVAARRAEARGELVQAAGHYKGALSHGPDEQLTADLRRVQAGIALAQAEQLMASGRLEQAGLILARAKQLAPDSIAIDQALTRHESHIRYRDFVRQGDGFAEQGRFAQATRSYRKAREVLDTEQIRQRLDDTEFNHLLAQARSYINNKQWASAHGILNTAANLRITDELNQLRDQVRAELDKIKGGGDGHE